MDALYAGRDRLISYKKPEAFKIKIRKTAEENHKMNCHKERNLHKRWVSISKISFCQRWRSSSSFRIVEESFWLCELNSALESSKDFRASSNSFRIFSFSLCRARFSSRRQGALPASFATFTDSASKAEKQIKFKKVKTRN